MIPHGTAGGCYGCGNFQTSGFGAISPGIKNVLSTVLQNAGYDPAAIACIKQIQQMTGRKATADEIAACSSNPDAALWASIKKKETENKIMIGAAVVGGVALLGGIYYFAVHKKQ